MFATAVLSGVLISAAPGYAGARPVAPTTTPTSTTQAPAPTGGLDLTFRGSPAAPVVVLTNRGTKPCQVSTSAVGTVTLTSVQQGGRPVVPVAFIPTIDNGAGLLPQLVKTLAPGASLELALSTVSTPDGRLLASTTWSPVVATGAWYAVQIDQPVQLSASYLLPIPPTSGAPACPAAIGSGTVQLLTKQAQHGSWLLVAAGTAVAIFLVALIMTVLSLFRRRPRPPAAAPVRPSPAPTAPPAAAASTGTPPAADAAPAGTPPRTTTRAAITAEGATATPEAPTPEAPTPETPTPEAPPSEPPPSEPPTSDASTPPPTPEATEAEGTTGAPGKPGGPSSTAVGLVILAMLATAGAVFGSTGRADASFSVGGLVQPAFKDCQNRFLLAGGDPMGILPLLDQKKFSVTVQYDPTNGESTVNSTTVLITWDPFAKYTYDGTGGAYDPCSALYHELYHAWEDLSGLHQDYHECWTREEGRTGISIKEVNATRAQNAWRVANGLPPRDQYDGHALPKGECVPGSWVPWECRPDANGHERCAQTNGDPHLTTVDGRRYDFQAVGEFVATNDPRGGFQVQVRQQPYPGSKVVAVNTAVAADVAGDRVEIRLAGRGETMLVNGTQVPMASAPLPGGGTVLVHPDPYGTIVGLTWPDGSTVGVIPLGTVGLHVVVQPASVHSGHLEGLFGDFDGRPDNDVTVRGAATPIAKPSFDTLYPGFADSWRVTTGGSLFTYQSGTSTETYTDHGFPSRPAVAADLPNRAWADAVCRDFGVVEATALADCTLDLGLTGRPELIAGAMGEQAVATTPAVDGTVIGLTISNPGGIARLAFTGSAGQKVLVQVVATTLADQCGGVLSLHGPDDTVLASGCLIGGTGGIDTTVLPKTGSYAIVIHPVIGSTGRIQLRVVTPNDQTGVLTVDGPPVVAMVTVPGGVARLSFAGTAGDKVFVDVAASTFPNQCALPQLVAPDHTVLASGCTTGTGFIDGQVLPATGRYSLVFDPTGTGTGAAKVRVVRAVDTTATATVGGAAVDLSVSQPGGVARLTFTGTAGHRVFVDVAGATFPAQCGLPTVEDPAHQVVASGCTTNGTGSVELPAFTVTGTYTVVLDPAERSTGTAKVRLIEVVDQTGQVTVNGPAVAVHIGQPSGQARLTFAGTAGQVVTVTMTKSTMPDQCGLLLLLDQANQGIQSACVVGGTGAIAPVTLPRTGQYTVLVDPAERVTGDALVSVHS
jgi:VWD domain-containing protein